MNKFSLLAIAAIFSCLQLAAQPRWSPAVRSEREMRWMKDSLNITEAQASQISGFSLTYQQQMDAAADQPGKKKNQARLMKKKDTRLKAILTKEQYQKYYKREEMIRKQDQIVYKGHQPL